jgi:hypothetical protein
MAQSVFKGKTTLRLNFDLVLSAVPDTIIANPIKAIGQAGILPFCFSQRWRNHDSSRGAEHFLVGNNYDASFTMPQLKALLSRQQPMD